MLDTVWRDKLVPAAASEVMEDLSYLSKRLRESGQEQAAEDLKKIHAILFSIVCLTEAVNQFWDRYAPRKVSLKFLCRCIAQGMEVSSFSYEGNQPDFQDIRDGAVQMTEVLEFLGCGPLYEDREGRYALRCRCGEVAERGFDTTAGMYWAGCDSCGRYVSSCDRDQLVQLLQGPIL